MRDSFAALWSTFRDVRRYRAVFFFLLAYWMYIDGVNTIRKWRWTTASPSVLPASLIQAILMVQFIGFPAALLFGWIGQRISPVVGIFICIAVYALVTVYATVLNNSRSSSSWPLRPVACRAEFKA